MTRLITLGTVLTLTLLATPAHAQWAVYDAANWTQTSHILETARKEVTTVTEQLGFLTRMADRLTGMDRFRTPAVVASRPDPNLFPWARPFLEALNSGDARDERYRQSVRALPELAAILDPLHLPVEARRAIETQYANLQIFDAVIPRAVHQSAIIRNFTALDRALEALGDDVTSGRNATHYLTATMQKAAGGILIQNRQAANAMQTASGTLEQLIAQNTVRRNDAAAAMNFTLGIVQDDGGAAAAQISGASDAIARWSLR